MLLLKNSRKQNSRKQNSNKLQNSLFKFEPYQPDKQILQIILDKIRRIKNSIHLKKLES